MHGASFFWKPFGVDEYNLPPNTDMLYYWNFIMVAEGTIAERIRYKVLDLVGEAGGILAAASYFLAVFF